MKIPGAGMCPLVRVGDIVKGRTVIDIVCDRNVGATCSAYKTLAMLRLADPKKQWRFVEPPRVVNCNVCPVLAKDPDNKSKTKWQKELIDEAMMRGDHYIDPIDPSIGVISKSEHEPKEAKPVTRDRFELIDINDSEEEEQDEESSSDPNKQ